MRMNQIDLRKALWEFYDGVRKVILDDGNYDEGERGLQQLAELGTIEE